MAAPSSAVRTELSEPTRPSNGPPHTSPAAPAWPSIESTVARTPGARPRFTRATISGWAVIRTQREAQNAINASQNTDATAKVYGGSREYRWTFYVPVMTFERREIVVQAPATKMRSRRWDYEVPALRAHRPIRKPLSQRSFSAKRALKTLSAAATASEMTR